MSHHPAPRPAHVVLLLLLLGLGGLAATLLHAAGGPDRHAPREAAARTLVRELELTDLALFTEARYTRHLALADRHTPFQDHPGALEHFPSGSLIPPPPHLNHHADLD